MADNYTFRDAYGSVITAASKDVGGAQQPIVQINSALGSLPVSLNGGSASVSGVGVFNVNPVGSGSVITVLSNSSVAALQGTNPWVISNPSVQVVGQMPPQSVSGVGLFNTNHTGNGSILVVVPGSVATVPSPASVSGVGLFNVNHTGNGSVITVWPTPSIIGTYAEDSAHANNAPGLFVFGVRNDTVSSFVSNDTDYTPTALDAAGRTLVKPFAPDQATIRSVSSTVSTNITSLFGVAGTGLKNYVTDLLVANTGSVATLVSFRDGDASVIARTIAPATGGSNIRFNVPIQTGGFNQPVEFSTNPAVSILHVTALGYKAQ